MSIKAGRVPGQWWPQETDSEALLSSGLLAPAARATLASRLSQGPSTGAELHPLPAQTPAHPTPALSAQ